MVLGSDDSGMVSHRVHKLTCTRFATPHGRRCRVANRAGASVCGGEDSYTLFSPLPVAARSFYSGMLLRAYSFD